jgi:hypothetical protein
MLNSLRRVSANALHASADVLVATVAGGLVAAVFYPLTLGAAGVKGAVRILRPRPNGAGMRGQPRRQVPQS